MFRKWELEVYSRFEDDWILPVIEYQFFSEWGARRKAARLNRRRERNYPNMPWCVWRPRRRT